jgi:polyribonucleotide nucleotidyltransferase
MIRKIVDETKCTIDVNDDGTVIIGSTSAENAKKAIEWIERLTKDVEPGNIYTGKVTRLMAFGAFVEVLPGKEGLIHISELADYRVGRVEDVVNVGDEVTVLVTEIDRQGRINLSRRALLEPSPEASAEGGGNGEVDGGGGERAYERRGARGGYGDRDRGPRREGGYGDRGPRREGGYGDRPPRREGYGDRGPREGGYGDRDRGPRREGGYGDRPPRREGSYGDRPPREGGYSDRPPRDGGYGGRGPRRGPRGPRPGGDDHPGDDRPPRDPFGPRW